MHAFMMKQNVSYGHSLVNSDTFDFAIKNLVINCLESWWTQAKYEPATYDWIMMKGNPSTRQLESYRRWCIRQSRRRRTNGYPKSSRHNLIEMLELMEGHLLRST